MTTPTSGDRDDRGGEPDRSDALGGGSDRNDDFEEPDIGDVVDDLEELEEAVEDEAVREQVRETIETAIAAQPRATFGRVIRGFDRADASEALVGAVLFGIPMAVEGGTNEVGAFVATNPVYLVATHLVAVALVYGIIYVAEIQDVRIYRPYFGIVPRRLFGVMTIAFLTAAGMLTAWGRVDWSEPWLAVCTVSVAFVPMALGAALGDILPGS